MIYHRKTDVCVGTRCRLPKAKEIAETDEGDGSGLAQLAGSSSSYKRNDKM